MKVGMRKEWVRGWKGGEVVKVGWVNMRVMGRKYRVGWMGFYRMKEERSSKDDHGRVLDEDEREKW